MDKDYIPGSGDELDAEGISEETAQATEEIIEEAAEEIVNDAADEVEDTTADEVEDEDTEDAEEDDGTAPRQIDKRQYDMIPINRRYVGISILLSMCLGFYAIYWMYLLVKNTKAIKKDNSSCTGEMLCLLFVPFYAFYWLFTRGKLIKDYFASHGYTTTCSGTAYLLLGLFGLGIVSLAIMQNDFNSLPSEFTDASTQLNQRSAICPNCHKNPMARGHRYCRKCEKKIVKVRAPFGGHVAGFVSLITALCAFVLAFLLMPASLQVAQGDFFAARHNWYSAGMSYNGVSDVITQVTDSVGENSPLKQVIATGSNFDFKIYKTLVNMYGLFRANQAKSNIFKSPGSAEFTAKSNKLAVYDAMFEKFSNTYQAVSDIMTEIDYSETRDKKLGEESVKKMEAARGKEGVDDIALDYFIANVIMACEMGDDLEREQLEKVKAKDEATEEDYSWLYYEDLIKFYMKTKDYDKALPLIEAELKKNTSNFTPAYCKAKIIASKGDTKALEDFIGEFCRNNTNLDGSQSDSNYSLLIYYLRVTGDYSHAKDMIEQAKSVYNLNSDFDRQLALVCLVEGDYDAAFEAIWAAEESANYRAQMYQDSSAYTEEFFATSYLAAYMCDKYGNKDSENASHLPEVLEYYKDGAPNDTVDKIIKGELTIEKVLTEGVYDVA